MLFPDRAGEPDLVVCSDTVAARRDEAAAAFGYREVTDDWRSVCEHPDVDVVVVTAPNMLHVDVVEAACASGKHVFCEKPVGGTPEQTARAAAAARAAGVITGVGYNYRFAPLVRHAAELIRGGEPRRAHELPRPLLLDVRERPARSAELAVRAGRGGLRRLLATCSATASTSRTCSSARSSAWSGCAPRPSRSARSRSRAAGHYGRGRAGDPTGPVTNEDYVGALAIFANGVRRARSSRRAR